MSDLLEIGQSTFADRYGVAPVAVRHHLVGHPLLTVEMLAELADELPPDKTEHNLGNISTVVADAEVPSLGVSAGEVARTIESSRSWLILRNIEIVPRYKALLDACLDEVEPLVGRREGPMEGREGFVFLSAPNSVTPSHFDPEHNFLLQIRGTKTMNVGQFDDAAMEHRELERYYGGGHSNMPSEPRDIVPFGLEPGDGIYLPPHAPHFVRNGPAVSVSLSITWRTAVTQRRAVAYQANARLRRMRLRPRPPGQNATADRAKEAAVLTNRALSRRLSRVRRRAED
ncbi:MAG: transcriptional regulator [Actinomycetota bacterium]|nr:transcriptional regulator [Actinomycetota bacterium]